LDEVCVRCIHGKHKADNGHRSLLIEDAFTINIAVRAEQGRLFQDKVDRLKLVTDKALGSRERWGKLISRVFEGLRDCVDSKEREMREKVDEFLFHSSSSPFPESPTARVSYFQSLVPATVQENNASVSISSVSTVSSNDSDGETNDSKVVAIKQLLLEIEKIQQCLPIIDAALEVAEHVEEKKEMPFVDPSYDPSTGDSSFDQWGLPKVIKVINHWMKFPNEVINRDMDNTLGDY
jgi:hypothetical protein